MLLQSCGGLNNLPITAVELSETTQELNNQDYFGQVSNKQLVSKEGYAVTILQKKKEEQLQAKVIEKKWKFE